MIVVKPELAAGMQPIAVQIAEVAGQRVRLVRYEPVEIIVEVG